MLHRSPLTELIFEHWNRSVADGTDSHKTVVTRLFLRFSHYFSAGVRPGAWFLHLGIIRSDHTSYRS